MAGAFIDIRFDDDEFQRLLQEIERRAGSMRPAMHIIGQIAMASVRQNFLAGGRPERWKPLAQPTLWNLIGGSAGHTKNGALRARSRRRLDRKKILVGRGMRGGLMGSVHYQASSNQVLVGTDKPYGAIHHFGGTIPAMTIRPTAKQALFWAGAVHPVKQVHRPAINIPARPWLLLQDDDLPHIKRTAMEYLRNG